MTQIIYVDVLIFVNLFVNYFIVLWVAKILNLLLKRWKLILAAGLGAMYSFVIFLPKINIFLSILLKILMSLSIVLVAFGFFSIKKLIKITACFYAISFTFAGIVFFLWYFTNLNCIFVKNGAFYFDISPLFLIISTFVTYCILKLFNICVGQRETLLNFCTIIVKYDDESIKLKAKVDTGNTLREPFSNIPVVVTHYKIMESILKSKGNFDSYDSFLLNVHNTSTAKKLKVRMVPYKTVHGDGVFPAFKVEKLEINYAGKTFEKEAFIAICRKNMLNDVFDAIINPELVDL